MKLKIKYYIINTKNTANDRVQIMKPKLMRKIRHEKAYTYVSVCYETSKMKINN